MSASTTDGSRASSSLVSILNSVKVNCLFYQWKDLSNEVLGERLLTFWLVLAIGLREVVVESSYWLILWMPPIPILWVLRLYPNSALLSRRQVVRIGCQIWTRRSLGSLLLISLPLFFALLVSFLDSSWPSVWSLCSKARTWNDEVFLLAWVVGVRSLSSNFGTVRISLLMLELRILLLQGCHLVELLLMNHLSGLVLFDFANPSSCVRDIGLFLRRFHHSI